MYEDEAEKDLKLNIMAFIKPKVNENKRTKKVKKVSFDDQPRKLITLAYVS